MHARNQFTKGGVLLKIMGVVMDITDQVLREEYLREAEQEAKRKADAARRMAHTDALTGLSNRRAVMAWLDRTITMCRSSQAEVSLIVFDIDHFKAVNDTYGHQAGDQVLRQIAKIARKLARQDDLVGRMGGEEFVVGMADAGTFVTRTVAERLRRAIAAKSGAGGVPPVTVSIGYASWREGDTSLSLFAKADAALYAAKDGGQNQVRQAA